MIVFYVKQVLIRTLGSTYIRAISLVLQLLTDVLNAVDGPLPGDTTHAAITRLVRDASFAIDNERKLLFAKHFSKLVLWMGLNNGRLRSG
jgi:hypothetical protein